MRKRLAHVLAAILVLASALASTRAAADDYDPQRAGHPLRILAYAGHPIGVALDYLIFRPSHWVGSREPWRTIFGHERTTAEIYGKTGAYEHPLPYSHAPHSQYR
jgi:hypothetical protein